jgi:two-component system CheB/CheR fusion protein
MSEQNNTQYTDLQPKTQPVPIVAVGGSAGGQQAMSELLGHLSADTGLAYVYIQHLSPDFDSKLDFILSSKTAMPVTEAVHLMQVRPDHVYVIPPNKDMEVIDGVLVLMPRKSRPKLHHPIDQFFASLAERQKDGAIGIVLSGMASDGTLGLKAIKVAGGITFAQDESAAFQSMPQSAISEGVVDMVLPPKEIALELLRLSKNRDIFRLSAESDEIIDEESEDEDFKKILLFVKAAMGVDFTNYKKTTIKRRIVRRMLLYKLETLKDYFSYLKQHPSEASILYSDLLINVTSFFRDTETMEHLKKEIIPKLVKDKSPSDAVRVWVAGCSTGQEAYSLAILMIEVMADHSARFPVQIFATDLSDAAVAKARLGQYSKSEIADISQQRLERFFTRTDDHYRVNKLVRDMCVFAPHNLLSDPPFSRMDLISCRNLLIYLDDALQKKVVSTFHYALKPSGYLLLGKSESVVSSPAHFAQIEKTNKIFTRKNNAQGKILPDIPVKATALPQENRITNIKRQDLVSTGDLDKLVDNLLLSKYVPASVVIDQDLEIIQFRGSTSTFLQHRSGRASLNLAKMAHPSLVFELRNIVHKARKSAHPEKKSNLEFKQGDKTIYINIEAVPITNPINQQLFLILFEELHENLIITERASGHTDKRNQQLEDEIAALRQDMHSIIEEQEASNEELQSANEEIVSSNEELQSINEELETSKEEIQSANEELQTINQELQVRNDLLTESYEYSEAILSTINEATMILDEQLRVKSANEAFYKIFETDPAQTEGLNIYEFGNRQLDFSEFRNVLHEVVSRDTAVRGLETEIRISASKRRNMIINAKKVVQHRKQTVLLAFEDVTAHRREQALLQERQKWFEELVDNAPAMIWVCNPDGKINFLNKAWVDFTGRGSGDRDMTFYDCIHPLDLKSYKKAFDANIKMQKPFRYEYRLKMHDGTYKWVLENAKPLTSEDGEFTGYTGTSMDIHLQKTLTEQLNKHVDERTTELKQANDELKRTADRLQSVLNGVPASVTLMQPIRNTDGTVIDFSISVYNEKTLELTGQTSNQILSTGLLESVPSLKEDGLFSLYTEVLESGTPAYREHTGIQSAHETLAYLITPQVDKSGIVVTTLDITQRKQAEMRLSRTAENLQAVLDSSPASIAFFKAIKKDKKNIDFLLAVCNKKFSSASGKTPGELAGTSASDLFSPEKLDAFQHVYELNKSYYYEENMPEDHKWKAVSISRHDHGVAITEIDITVLKTAQNRQDEMLLQLNGSYEMIESLSVMKEYVQHRGAFLRTTFHDLRGSFGVIVGAVTLLNMMESEEERLKVLDMIQRNLNHVAQMMNQLLDYSRLESGEETLQITQFDAASFLHELCLASVQTAAQKGLTLSFQGEGDLLVDGDLVKVRRISQNLILNAIKYTSHGGVSVRWRSVDVDPSLPALWEFTVSDTGPGITSQLLSKLDDSSIPQNDGKKQEPYPDPNTDGQGEGIGLFIVKRLCELLKAKLHVRSDDASGTTFRIIFPKSYSS